MSKTTNADIVQSTKKNYQICCKYCDWHITYLNSTYWKVERQMEMFASMPQLPTACSHRLEIKELS